MARSDAEKRKGYTKGGYRYRQEKGGKRVLRIGKAKKPAPKPTLSERVRKDPALLQKYLADPALRSKLPDKYLNQQQLSARRDREFRTNLGDVTQGLTGDTMIRTAEELVDREYAPQERALKRTRDQIAAQQARDRDWVRAYTGQLEGLAAGTVSQQQASNQRAMDAARQRDAEIMQGIGQVEQGQAQRAEDRASTLGPGLDGGAAQMLAEQAAQQRMRAQAQAGTQQQALSTNAQAQEAFLRGITAAAGQRRADDQAAIAARAWKRQSEVDADEEDLRKGRSGQLTKTLLGLREGEVERYLTEQRLATEERQAILEAQQQAAQLKSREQLERAKMRLQIRLKQMGIDADTAELQASQAFQRRENELDRSQDERQSRRSDRTTRRGQDISAQDGGGGGGKGKGGHTQANIISARKDFANVLSSVADTRKQGLSIRSAADLGMVPNLTGPPVMKKIAFEIHYGRASRNPKRKQQAISRLKAYNKTLKRVYGISIPRRYLK